MVLHKADKLARGEGTAPARVATRSAQDSGPAQVPVPLSRKAQLRHVAVRDYARLRAHARNCTDCVPGATDTDPPRINRGCRIGMAGKYDYLRSYRAWVNCPEVEGS